MALCNCSRYVKMNVDLHAVNDVGFTRETQCPLSHKSHTHVFIIIFLKQMVYCMGQSALVYSAATFTCIHFQLQPDFNKLCAADATCLSMLLHVRWRAGFYMCACQFTKWVTPHDGWRCFFEEQMLSVDQIFPTCCDVCAHVLLFSDSSVHCTHLLLLLFHKLHLHPNIHL